jgi:hypothetical protein
MIIAVGRNRNEQAHIDGVLANNGWEIDSSDIHDQ